MMALALGSTGCVEQGPVSPFYPDDPTGATATRTQDATVTVRTRFVVAGADRVDSEVALDRLYLHVGSLLLEPIEETPGVSFASREPFALDFDLANGQTVLAGPVMTLPYGGDFAVLVQVEPREVERDDAKEAAPSSSVEVDGRWYYTDIVDGVAPRSDEPSPLPWRQGAEKSADGRAYTQELDFVYRAADVARIQLAEIEMNEAGDYDLTLTLRVDAWLERDVLPALADLVVPHPDRPFDVPDFDDPAEEGEPLEPILDSDRVALEGLVGDIETSTARRR
jgi:hypothetical protein